MNNFNQFPNFSQPPPGFAPNQRGNLNSNSHLYFQHNQQNPGYNGHNYFPYPYSHSHNYPPMQNQQHYNRNTYSQSNSNYNHRPRNRNNTPQSVNQNSISNGKVNKSKKNKTLGHHTTPTKLNYTKEDVERALKAENENNKQDNKSLMVRIPDPIINREIVQKLHPAIKEVNFPQCSSNPRSCFATLKDNADADKTIEDLNKTKFGDGYLTAEYKKDPLKKKEIDDLDPLHLFVGNLNYNVSRSDIVKLIPVHSRLDIGYSKQRQSTRYAKIAFKTVDEAIEAYQNNCRRELKGKTLNVRFFRNTDEEDKKNSRRNSEKRENKCKNVNNANYDKPGGSQSDKQSRNDNVSYGSYTNVNSSTSSSCVDES